MRFVALALTFLTGFSGLVYEVAWQKYLATLLGSHSEATAAVLGIFLGGLSVGYTLFGRITRRQVERAGPEGARLLLLYGGVEGSIGLYALVFPLLFDAVSTVSLALPQGNTGSGFVIDVLLSALLIGPPAVLMGGTIPVLTQALATDLKDATRIHAFIYGFNTAGAFLGALAAGFVLVPTLGLRGVVISVGVINLAAGGIFAALGVGRRQAAIEPEEEAGETVSAAGVRTLCGVALLSGFAMMTLQTVLIRLGGLSFGASHFTFAMVVACFVLCIALGSFVVSALPRIRAVYISGSQALLVVVLLVLYFQAPNAPYWSMRIRILFDTNPESFYPYHLAAFAGVLAVLFVPIMLSGALLPLLFHHLRERGGGLGSIAGRIYAWNTVGSLLGALLGGYALLFWLDLDQVFHVAVLALAFGAAWLTLVLHREWRWRRPVCLVAVALVGLTPLPEWDHMKIAHGLFREHRDHPRFHVGIDAFYESMSKYWRVLFYDDDPAQSSAVLDMLPETPTDEGDRALMSNGKADSSIVGDFQTMALLGLLPYLLGNDCEESFVVGMGTGTTVGELAALDTSRRVVVAEISKGVIDAIPHFERWRLPVSENPKVEVIRGDAYRALMRSEAHFDAIVSEPSNPWVNGVEMLFAEEFYAAARQRLAPDGVYIQWFHYYEADEETMAVVLRTFARAFESTSLWYSMHGDLMLVGFNDPAQELDVAEIDRRANEPHIRSRLELAKIFGTARLLAHELFPIGSIRPERLPGPSHTLHSPILSDRAARGFFLGGFSEFPEILGRRGAEAGVRRSLLRHFLASDADRRIERLREATRETCTYAPRPCASMLARLRLDDPDGPVDEITEKSIRYWRDNDDHFDRELVRDLEHFFGSVTGLAVGSREAARQADLFLRHFHYATPFSFDFLDDRWENCFDEAGESCAAGRAEVERRLGESLPRGG